MAEGEWKTVCRNFCREIWEEGTKDRKKMGEEILVKGLAGYEAGFRMRKRRRFHNHHPPLVARH
jgi:hypothetical protein